METKECYVLYSQENGCYYFDGYKCFLLENADKFLTREEAEGLLEELEIDEYPKGYFAVKKIKMTWEIIRHRIE